MPRIVTERLVLETLTADEAAAIRAGDRRGRRWAEDYPMEGDVVVAGIVGEAGEHYDEQSPIGIMQARLASTGLAVGGVGFTSAPDADGVAEIGYGFAESARGQGLATEAVSAMIGWVAGLDVRAVEAFTTPENLPSQRVLQRCGFAQVGETATDEGVLLRWLRPLSG